MLDSFFIIIARRRLFLFSSFFAPYDFLLRHVKCVCEFEETPLSNAATQSIFEES